MIIFNAAICGLGPNGGSQTIVKSAQVLRSIGASVGIVAGVDRHTWTAHEKCLTSIPDNATAVIAASALDVMHAQRHAPDRAKVYWWLRGWENWQVPDEGLFNRAKSVSCISNTGWIADRLRSHGIACQICYSGIDLSFWHRVCVFKSEKPTIGCLYHRKSTKRFDLFEKLYSKFGDRFEYVSYGASGADTFCNVEVQPVKNRIRELYSMCDVWLAPTESEGFHNVAAEAALCGCQIVCNRLTTNGMGDYANDATAYRYDSESELCECIQRAIDSGHRQKQRMVSRLYQIGDRVKNMKRLMEIVS